MSLETSIASKVRMKAFATHEQFNEWVQKNGRGIRMIHISNIPGKENTWRILLTYQQLEKVENAKD